MFLLIFVLFLLVKSLELFGQTSEIQIPDIKKIVLDMDSAFVEFLCSDCPWFHQKAFLIQANISCSTDWCKKRIDYFNPTSRILEINDLSPFTNYVVHFRFCENKLDCASIVRTKYFTTKPAAPRSIKEITVYSKNETSISLKVKPPHPPTGNLEIYKVIYEQGSLEDLDEDEDEYTKPEEFFAKTCNLWPSYHCFTIFNLTSDQQYNLYLQSRNENCLLFSQNSDIIRVVTKKEPSDAPYDLNIIWTNNKQLYLNWKHPNKTNGDIEYFNITLVPDQDRNKDNTKLFIKYEIAEYALQYTFQLNVSEWLRSTRLQIRISAYNGNYGQELISSVPSPPDDVSSLPDNLREQTQKKETTTIKYINLKKSLIFLFITSVIICLFFWTSKITFGKTIRNGNNDYLSQEESFLRKRHVENRRQSDIKLSSLDSGPQLCLNDIITETTNQDNKNNTEECKNEEDFIDFSKPIEFNNFQEYIKTAQKNGTLEHEYKEFIENAPKPIYDTVDQFCEYIDFMYSNGTKIPKAYVVTKTPTEDEIPNLWLQIWEDNIEFIAVLGEVGSKNSRYRYQPYWPEKDKKIECHDLTIQQVYNKDYPTYVIRKFILIRDEDMRQLVQIHCPYYGQDVQKYVPFFTKMLQLQLKTTFSTLVHSSIGFGGAGFVILCNMCIRIAEKERIIDVLKNLQLLRKYKSGLIRNAEQYKLVHLVILHVLFNSEDNLGEDPDLNDYSIYLPPTA